MIQKIKKILVPEIVLTDYKIPLSYHVRDLLEADELSNEENDLKCFYIQIKREKYEIKDSNDDF